MLAPLIKAMWDNPALRTDEHFLLALKTTEGQYSHIFDYLRLPGHSPWRGSLRTYEALSATIASRTWNLVPGTKTFDWERFYGDAKIIDELMSFEILNNTVLYETYWWPHEREYKTKGV